MVPKPYGVGYLAFYPLITYCFYTVVPLLAHGVVIFQIYCLLFPFRLSKTKTGVITHRFTVRTGSEPVLSFTSSEEPQTGPIGGLVNLDWTEPEPLVRFKGSRFEPRVRTELRQPYPSVMRSLGKNEVMMSPNIMFGSSLLSTLGTLTVDETSWF